MDRASILGDAIEYLKELLQRINDLHNELESTPAGSSLTPASSFHPLTPTPSSLPGRIKEELCPSSLPSPNGQPARVMLFVCPMLELVLLLRYLLKITLLSYFVFLKLEIVVCILTFDS
jgi:hypothetical protein